MKILIKTVLTSLLIIVGLELASSYFLFRYYAATQKELSPNGLAVGAVVDRITTRLHGKTRSVQVSIDHGPLFRTDPVLGYALNPGSFQITERWDNRSHGFHLDIDEALDRKTGYVANDSPRRIIMAADSALFGWGLEDQFTVPWLLQSRLPDFHVVNASLTSYSTIQALLRIEQIQPKVNDQDIIVLVYHPVTDDFNVAADETLRAMAIGYELQLGSPEMADMLVPFGVVDAQGELAIHRVPLGCLKDKTLSVECRRDVSPRTAARITELALDKFLDLHAGHVVLAYTSGGDDNPVIAYARSKGIIIADGRPPANDPDANDAIITDSHAGPFWHYHLFVRLLAQLKREHLVE